MKSLKKFLILFIAVLILIPVVIFSPRYLNQNTKSTKIANTENNPTPTQNNNKPDNNSSVKSVPNKHHIKTAFVNQAPEGDWSQPWQDACEEAAILVVDYFYKKITPSKEQIKNDILSMINFEEQNNFEKSINTSQMKTITTEYLSYQSKIISDPSIEEIKEYISQNIPVIVPADGKNLFQENRYFSNGGPNYHNIVLIGYDDKQQKFIVHDVGTRHGANFKYSYDLIMESIHDFPKSKKDEDIKTGDKNILILLK